MRDARDARREMVLRINGSANWNKEHTRTGVLIDSLIASLCPFSKGIVPLEEFGKNTSQTSSIRLTYCLLVARVFKQRT